MRKVAGIAEHLPTSVKRALVHSEADVPLLSAVMNSTPIRSMFVLYTILLYMVKQAHKILPSKVMTA